MLVSTISRGNKYVRHIKVVSFEKNERKNKLKKAAACTFFVFIYSRVNRILLRKLQRETPRCDIAFGFIVEK